MNRPHPYHLCEDNDCSSCAQPDSNGFETARSIQPCHFQAADGGPIDTPWTRDEAYYPHPYAGTSSSSTNSAFLTNRFSQYSLPNATSYNPQMVYSHTPTPHTYGYMTQHTNPIPDDYDVSPMSYHDYNASSHTRYEEQTQNYAYRTQWGTTHDFNSITICDNPAVRAMQSDWELGTLPGSAQTSQYVSHETALQEHHRQSNAESVQDQSTVHSPRLILHDASVTHSSHSQSSRHSSTSNTSPNHDLLPSSPLPFLSSFLVTPANSFQPAASSSDSNPAAPPPQAQASPASIPPPGPVSTPTPSGEHPTHEAEGQAKGSSKSRRPVLRSQVWLDKYFPRNGQCQLCKSRLKRWREDRALEHLVSCHLLQTVKNNVMFNKIRPANTPRHEHFIETEAQFRFVRTYIRDIKCSLCPKETSLIWRTRDLRVHLESIHRGMPEGVRELEMARVNALKPDKSEWFNIYDKLLYNFFLVE